MRKQDIKTGVVYAYRRGTYGRPEPMVFLGLGVHRHKKDGSKPWAAPDPGLKPSRGTGYFGSDYGYPVATGSDATPHDLLTALGADLIGAAGVPEHLFEAGISRDIITSLSYVLGPWDEVIAAYEAEEQRKKQASDAARRVREDEDATCSEAIASLKERGITATRSRSAGGIVLPVASAEKLVIWLADNL